MMKKINKQLFLLILVSLPFFSGCVSNSVTGEKSLSLVSEKWELDIGREQYGPTIQSQSGEYVANPSVNRYVRNVLSRLTAVSDRKLPYEIVVINSSVPNAWALPSGKMAINRGLLVELKSEAELAAVLGHEIVHAAASHGAQSYSRGQLLNGALKLGEIATNGASARLLKSASIGAQLISQKYGRAAEFESDKYGMLYMSRAGYDPRAAIDLQKTFVRLSKGRQSSWLEGLFASHPPSQQRVNQNMIHAQNLPQGGFLGIQEYQKAMKPLIDSQKAYDAYDEAKKLISNKEYKKAKSLLSQAKGIERNEGLFDLLEGDIDFYQNNYKAAISQYNKAISKNPSYFENYFSRGVASYKAGVFDLAYQDLKKTESLIPGFVNNSYYLGLLEKQRNNIEQSIKYFIQVANSKSSYSEESKAELQKMYKLYPEYFK